MDSKLEKLKNQSQVLQSAFLEQTTNQLNNLVEEIISEVKTHIQPEEINNINGKTKLYKKSRDSEGSIPVKQFIARDSLMTELFQVNHIRTLYNIFVAVLVILFLNTVLFDIINEGRINLDFEIMKFAFGKFQVVLTIWFSMQLCMILLLFPFFHFWAHNRQTLLKGKQVLTDKIFLFLYIIYFIGFLILPTRVLVMESLPPASSLIILCEQTRMLMKSHAFIRENVTRAKAYKVHQDGPKNNVACPDFGKFLYFLFVPTIIYRDEYPRTNAVNWKYVARDFLQVGGCIFYMYYIFMRFLIPAFHTFGHSTYTLEGFLLCVFGCIMPATLIFFISFFAILHAWMNAFAEMLKFADRMFYRDWWNSTSYADYYRTWNVVVHDWLYTYIYRDLSLLTGNGRLGPMFMVFFISAVWHEYLLTFAFGFFYPVLFVMFGGVGVVFIFITDKKKSAAWNIFMWISLFIGNGMLMCFYSMEWYARKNCAPVFNDVWDYAVPRSWFCTSLSQSS